MWRNRVGRRLNVEGLAIGGLCLALAAGARGEPGGEISWVEDFSDDPVAAGRFAIPDGHDASRFTYDAAGELVTVHYDTLEPTAWYARPLDSADGRLLDRYDTFQFAVTFKIRGRGFFADPNQFAQLGWGLLNSQTTGADRSGGTAGPYAFDVVAFDYFPNVSPLFGGPTLGPTIIHGDDGAGFFANIDFAFGAETTIDTTLGEEAIALDAVYTTVVEYRGADQVATLSIAEGAGALAINVDGAGGAGGFDGNAATIQAPITIDNGFVVDSFALTAWQDTFNPLSSSVIADVEVSRVEFFASAAPLGDLSLDGALDGRDVGPFVELALSPDPDPQLAARGDFNGDGMLDVMDVGPFVDALVAP